MIKVVAFDLDDTLWDSRPVLLKAEEYLNEWLADNAPGLVYSVEEMRDLRTRVLEEDPDLIHFITEFRRRVIEKALQLSDFDTETATRLSHAAMEVFLEARNRIELSRETLDVLDRLARHYMLGALTNGNADIVTLGLDRYFSFAFSAEEVGAAKPAPDLFHAAARHTGSRPHEMVYVGDDPILDIDPAKTVGWHTVLVKNPRREKAGVTLPDVTISGIVDLPSAIAAIDGD